MFKSQKGENDIPEASAVGAVSLSNIASELELTVDESAFVNIVTVDVEEYAKA